MSVSSVSSARTPDYPTGGGGAGVRTPYPVSTTVGTSDCGCEDRSPIP